MLFPLLPVSLLGAASAILSFSSISNMLEMYNTVGRHQRLTSVAISSSSAASILTEAKTWISVDEAVLELRKMPRRELIQLYLECRSDEAFGVFNAARENISYDGYLLDNGPVLVSNLQRK